MSFFPVPAPVPAVMLPGQNRVLLDHYAYSWRDRGYYHKMMLPPAFVWDQASIPRPFWLRLAPSDLHPAAGLLHDWPYRWAGEMPGYVVCAVDDAEAGWRRPENPMSRVTADRLFRGILESTDVAWRYRNAGYGLIRVFGGGHFRRAADPMDKDGVLDRYPEIRMLLP